MARVPIAMESPSSSHLTSDTVSTLHLAPSIGQESVASEVCWKGIWRNSLGRHTHQEQNGSRPGWLQWSDPETGERYTMSRGLRSRHLMMIAIGGTIGSSIFLTSGSTIATAGPGGALLAYGVVGAFVYAVVIALGEMSAMFPVPGAFAALGTRFVSPALGFSLGWSYWFQWILSISFQLLALSQAFQFWAPQIQPWHWALIIIGPVFALQFINVRAYGESEYWLSMIKVLMVVVFIIVGLICDWGGIKGHPGPGLSNFKDGKAFQGGFLGFCQTFVNVFVGYGGIELVAVAAGEAARPYRSVPRATKATFWRILIFYILTVLTVGLWMDTEDFEIEDNTVKASLITLVFQRAGFDAAAHLINAVIITAVLSAANSAFYASSRVLVSLACAGQAPRIFGCVNRRGVPIPAILLALIVTIPVYLTTIWADQIVFTWLFNLTSVTALIVWGSVGVLSIRFRQALRAQNVPLSDLPYRQPLYPLLPATILTLALVIFVAEGYVAIAANPYDYNNVATSVVATYIGVISFVLPYAGYTIYERFYLKIRQHFIPLARVDLKTDGQGPLLRQYVEQQYKAGLPPIGPRSLALRTITKHVY